MKPNFRAFQCAYHDTPVREFSEAFGVPVHYDPRVIPSLEDRILRVKLLAEELSELAKAFALSIRLNSKAMTASVEELEGAEYDPIEAADALGDLRYVVDGGNLLCGFPGDLVLAEIHRSNMSKLGEDGKPVLREDGKILKGPGYSKPDIKQVLFGTLVKEQNGK